MKVRRHRKRSVCLGIFLIILFNLAAGEILLRFVVFAKYDFLAPIKKAQYFSRYDSYNYQRLNAMFVAGDAANRMFPDAELGWTGNFSATDYHHVDEKKIGNRRVVLLFGDSFANCMNSPVTYQDLFAKNKKFSKSYYLLNYAVDGYGVDQIYLLLKKVIGLYDNPLVIFTFTTIDLDRTVVRLGGKQKPYFTIEDNDLHLHKPVPISLATFLSDSPPTIHSYLWAFIDNVSHLIWQNVFRKDASVFGTEKDRIEPIKKLNKRLLTNTISLFKSRGIEYKVIIFHTNWRGESPIDKNDWRDIFLKKLFDGLHVKPILAKHLIQKNASAKKIPFHKYFLACGHPSTLYIKLVYNEICRVLKVKE